MLVEGEARRSWKNVYSQQSIVISQGWDCTGGEVSSGLAMVRGLLKWRVTSVTPLTIKAENEGFDTKSAFTLTASKSEGASRVSA